MRLLSTGDGLGGKTRALSRACACVVSVNVRGERARTTRRVESRRARDGQGATAHVQHVRICLKLVSILDRRSSPRDREKLCYLPLANAARR